jgi:hypothetical protein
MQLELEIAFFERHRSEWANEQVGRFALVKGESLVGTYDSPDDALSEGARRFGRESFLVRLILPPRQEVTIPALTMGLLDTRLSRSA